MTRHAPNEPLARVALAPLSILYRGAVGVRNWLFDRGALRSERLPVPVISVGNLTVGGTGKTPLVAAIAARLAANGARVAVLSRGYRGARSNEAFVLSDGTGPSAGPGEAGDEPVLLARQLPGVPVVVGADRRRTGRLAVERLNAGVLVLDDGFQHRWLERDLDIVVLDAIEPFGRYRLLPSGLLREPMDSLARADLVVVTRSHPGDALHLLREVIGRLNPGVPVFRAFHEPVGLVPVAGGPREDVEAFRGRRALAFCGIGNPEGFRSTLVGLGVDLAGFESFPDHHAYRVSDWTALVKHARRSGADCLITTEKDAVRLGPGLDAGNGESSESTSGVAIPAYALAIRCVLDPEDEFFERVDRAATPSGGTPA